MTIIIIYYVPAVENIYHCERNYQSHCAIKRIADVSVFFAYSLTYLLIVVSFNKGRLNSLSCSLLL